MSENTSNAKPTAPSVKTPSSSIIGLAVIAAVILLIMGGISTCKRNSAQKHDNDSSDDTERKNAVGWIIDSVAIVQLNVGVYSKYYYLPIGNGVSFEDATTPYCAEDGRGTLNCSINKEDISSKFGAGSHNGFRFKPQEKPGTLKFIYWSYKN